MSLGLLFLMNLPSPPAASVGVAPVVVAGSTGKLWDVWTVNQITWVV